MRVSDGGDRHHESVLSVECERQSSKNNELHEILDTIDPPDAKTAHRIVYDVSVKFPYQVGCCKYLTEHWR
jgi:hypothetical protein